jgi:hypothetical protein
MIVAVGDDAVAAIAARRPGRANKILVDLGQVLIDSARLHKLDRSAGYRRRSGSKCFAAARSQSLLTQALQNIRSPSFVLNADKLGDDLQIYAVDPNRFRGGRIQEGFEKLAAPASLIFFGAKVLK